VAAVPRQVVPRVDDGVGLDGRLGSPGGRVGAGTPSRAADPIAGRLPSSP
jgi:hypothetical protein